MTLSKTAILIIGAHRSGTSAIAGYIGHLTRANFGSLMMQSQHDNERGFYENEKVVKLNDDLLQELYRSWEDPRPISESSFDSARLNYLRKRSGDILSTEYKGADIIAIKDPRLSLTLPFWSSIIRAQGYKIQIVISHRRHQDIVASLRSREQLSEEHALYLTTLYVLSAEKHTRAFDRIWVDFDKALLDPKYLSSRLATLLEDSQLETHPTDWLDASLHHHEESSLSSSSWSDDRFEPIWQCYDLLKKISQDDGPTIAEEHLDTAYASYQQILKSKGDALLKNRVDHGKVIFQYKDQRDRIIESYQLNHDNNVLRFSWTKEDRPDSVLIIPIHRSALIVDLDIHIDGVTTYKLSHNSSWQKGEVLGFEDSQPRIIIKLSDKSDAQSVQCLVSYSYKDYQPTATAKKSIYSISLAAVFLLIKKPHKVFSVLNLENWKTLKSAIKREPPRQILRNLVRLINRDKISTNQITKRQIPVINEAQKYRKKVVYISPNIPAYDQSSGDRRADIILSILAKNSHVLCKVRAKPDQKYVDRLTAHGIQIISNSDNKWLEKIGKVDIIIYDKYYTFLDESHLRKYFPQARHIIDSVDVHWVREERGFKYNEDYQEARVSKNKQREQKAYHSATEVWVVSEPDRKAILATGIPSNKIRIVSNIHEVYTSEYTPTDRPILFFLGNYNHKPNEWTAQWLASDIFPHIKEKFNDAELWIGGTNAPSAIKDLGQIDGVSVIGYIPEEDLASIYEQALLVYAPLLAGAGVKGKLLEAISHMTPILTNDIGNEGLSISHEREGFIINTKEEILEITANILKEEYDLELITANAQKNILSKFSYLNAQKALGESLYPNIDICIVTHNRMDLLRSCISSIIEHTMYPNYRIHVYSNACTDGTIDYLKSMKKNYDHISTIYSKTNDVFVLPNNQLMKTSSYDVLLLNNDTEVSPGWLIGLHTMAYRSIDVGIVGPALYYPDGRIQELGAEIYNDGSGQNYYNGLESNDVENPFPHAVPYISGCAMYIKRELLDDIGLFDKAYAPCYFEDSDLCYRAWNNNWKVIVVPDITITHHGGATAGTSIDEGYKSFQQINAHKFLDTHSINLSKVKSQCKKANSTLSLV